MSNDLLDTTVLDTLEEEETLPPMSISTIKDEINSFLDIKFKKLMELSQSQLDFVDSNKLHKPKENYLFLLNLLNTIVTKFIHLEEKLENSLVQKLHEDIIVLKKVYDTQSDIYIDIEDLFNESFLDHSYILRLMKKNVRDQKSLNSYKKIKYIYLDIFSTMFESEKKKLLYALLVVINAKIFHLDRLLWIEANRSESIRRHIVAMKIEDSINSKNFIIAKLENEVYSKNYVYLQNCLRIYK